ncbi:hypothetical protein HMF8227_00320 [Saliniradius amylolyticus]|uniref:Uncharacterized protein n=1 Tax=Saliniradius amylolyticus TaxID=2183582 RepID=A0A2S2DZL7_9ALTE|nr:hypothetical protein [Saliniradius amylolyticus]AWL10826.1 hypothetical protein HMF8227_00320 [Saliniradius amylolyticus]
MSMLKKWTEAHKLFDSSETPKVVNSMLRHSPRELVIKHHILILTYVLGAIYFTWISSLTSWAYIGFVLFAGLVYCLRESFIGRDFSCEFEKYGLYNLPFFRRSAYLSYLRFVELANSSKVISKNDVKNLLKWDEVRQRKVTSLEYFKSPVVISAIGLTLSFVPEGLKYNGWSPRDIALYVIFMVTAVLFGWMIFDIGIGYSKKTSKICRYLQWWELEE